MVERVEDRSRERVTGCYATKIVLGEEKGNQTSTGGGRGSLYELGRLADSRSAVNSLPLKKRGDSIWVRV